MIYLSLVLLSFLLHSDSSVDLWSICNGVYISSQLLLTQFLSSSCIDLRLSYVLCQLVASALQCAAISEWSVENSTAIQLIEDKRTSSYMASRIF